MIALLRADGSTGDVEQQSLKNDLRSTQRFSDDFSSQQAGRSHHTSAEDTTYDITLNPDASWTNASFASWLCGNLTVSSSFKVSPVSFLPLPLLLPPCFYEFSSSFTAISFTQVLLIGNSSTDPDPLIRLGKVLGSSLKDLSLDSCTLATASGSSYGSNNWHNVFASMSSITSLAITSSGLTGSLPSSIPANMTLFSLSGNALSGSILNSLLANIDAKATSLTLDLSGNRLEGSIPLNLFSSLRLDSFTTFSISLANNALSGTIPSKDWLSSFSEATSFSLDLSSNGLSGDLEFFNNLNFNSLSRYVFAILHAFPHEVTL